MCGCSSIESKRSEIGCTFGRRGMDVLALGETKMKGKGLRSMTGVSRLDRVRNEVVRARTGVRRELAARVDVNVLRWFGHVERMDNERLLKKVMNAKVDGKSAKGRPRFGWMDGVKRALNDRRMDIREASERARNRNEWRMIVTQF